MILDCCLQSIIIYLFISLIFIIGNEKCSVESHGYLLEPANRASAWRAGFKTPPNYDDMGQICGRKCTPCGVPSNDAGGKYAKGVIVKKYNSGQTITAKVKITANHFGPFYFSLCANPSQATDSCFAKYPLKVVGSSGSSQAYRYDIPRGGGSVFDVSLKLPEGLSCNHCVFRWHWDAKNTGEKYRNCADISIGSGNSGGGVEEDEYDHRREGRDRELDEERSGRPEPEEELPDESKRERKTERRGSGKAGKCRAVSVRATNDWCNNNCSRGFCTKDFCESDSDI